MTPNLLLFCVFISVSSDCNPGTYPTGGCCTGQGCGTTCLSPGTYASGGSCAICQQCRAGFYCIGDPGNSPPCKQPISCGSGFTSAIGSTSSANCVISTSLSTPSAKASPPPTPSIFTSSSPSPSLSAHESPSMSPLQSLTNSPSQSPMSSMSALSTLSPTATLSASVTPTASQTPPPFSCLSRIEGCSTPTTAIGLPHREYGGMSSYLRPTPVPPPGSPSATVSWPFIVSNLTITFSPPPSLGELINVTCTGDKATSLVLANAGQPACSDESSPLFSACVSVPSSASGRTLAASATFTVHPLSTPILQSPQAVIGSVTCTVVSNPQSNSIFSSLPLPHYGIKTIFYTSVVNHPFSYILLDGIAIEGLGANIGAFKSVAGSSLSSLPSSFTPFPPYYALSSACPTVFPLSNSSSLYATVWSSPMVLLCSAAVQTLKSFVGSSMGLGGAAGTAAAAAAQVEASPTSLSVTISGKRHLLLAVSSLTPPPPTLYVTLGGVPGSVNWVLPPSPDGSSPALVSVTTPTLAALCNASIAVASSLSSLPSSPTQGGGGGGCGTFPLELLPFPPPLRGIPIGGKSSSSNSTTTTDATTAASSSSSPLLYVPSLYPPLLLPPTPWSTQALAALQGSYQPSPQGPPFPPLSPWVLASAFTGEPAGATTSTTSTTLALFQALVPPPGGLQVSRECQDPTFAPGELCGTVVGYRQPLLEAGAAAANATVGSTNFTCPWGGGDECQACPTPGFLCPGGPQLLPLPGHWAPALTSLPVDALPCPDPDALLRCPGYLEVASGGGLWGCGRGFRGVLCSACSAGFYRSLGSCAPCPTSSLALSLLVPIVVFLGGLGAGGLGVVGLVYAALLRRHPRRRFSLGAIWGQVQALLLWVWLSAQSLAALFTQAESLAPGALASVFRAASALQFQGITLDPACFSTIPFQTFWVGLGVMLGLVATGAAALVALPHCPARAHATLGATGLALLLGYGALTSVFSATMACTTGLPMSVAGYLNAISDGAALGAALGPEAPPMALLQRAAADPLFAASSGLSSVLRDTILVPVLVSNTFQVCGEGPHRVVRPAAMAATAIFSFGFPALGLWALWASGHLKGLKRRAGKLLLRRGQQQQQAMGSPRGAPCASALKAALVDTTLLQSRAWTGFFELLAVAVTTGCLAVSSQQGGLPLPAFLGAQAGIVLTNLTLMVVLAWGWSLYSPNHTWKLPAKLALCSIAIITAVFNATLTAFKSKLSGSVRLALCTIPLALSLIVLAVLFSYWWSSTLETIQPLDDKGALVKKEEEEEGERGAIEGGNAFHQVNPANILGLSREPDTVAKVKKSSPAPSPPPSLWRAVRYPDGDLAWASTLMERGGEEVVVVWELPPGAVTSCGWHHDIAGNRWEHRESGVVSTRPPPRVFHGRLEATENGHVVGFWHCFDTQESVFTLPEAPCQTACGWVAMGGRRKLWKHVPSGVEERHPPAPPLPPPTHVDSQPHPPIPEEPLWERVYCKSRGVKCWHCPQTGETVRKLPRGASTACGWVHSKGGGENGKGEWLHKPSGVKCQHAPSLVEREAEAYILSHFSEHVKEAWKAPFGKGGESNVSVASP